MIEPETIRMIVEVIIVIAATFFAAYWKKAKNYSKEVEVHAMRADDHVHRFIVAVKSFNKANEDDKITDEEWDDSYKKFKEFYDGIVDEVNRLRKSDA